MSWFLDFTPPNAPFSIDYRDEIFSLGSCFSEHIPNQMLDLGWKGTVNPFGLLYNPLSIVDVIDWLRKEVPSAEELFFHRGLWRHWRCHTSLASPSKASALEELQASWTSAKRAWENADILFLTLGTAYSWFDLEQEQTVSNCHQYSTDRFERRLLDIEDCVEKMNAVIGQFQERREDRRVIVTVSPIRYLRDGLIDSNRSKARLIEIGHQLVERNNAVYYFPSYEIMIDQLRDYRFYERDRVHPSLEATEFIWQQFSRNFSTETQCFVVEAQKIKRMFAHRVLHPDTKEGRRFLEKRERARDQFQKRYFT